MDRVKPTKPGVHPVAQIAGAIAATLLAVVATRCTAGGQLTPVMACRLDALKVLPSDPLNATVYDAVDVIQRVRACDRQHGDAGTP